MIVTFRRGFNFLKGLEIWGFILSTQSGLRILAPSDSEDGSQCISSGSMVRVEPFYGLPMDVELSSRFQDDATRHKELSKPLKEFATTHHMSLHGRPL